METNYFCYFTRSRVFHTSVSWWFSTGVRVTSKSPQVSKILLSILTNLNNAVVWMISTHPLISKSSNPFNNPLVTVNSTTITIGITVTYTFYNFVSSLARSRYLSLFSLPKVLPCDQSDNYYYYWYCSLLRVFHTSNSWWFLTGIWATTSLLKSPGIFSVFWPISNMK